MTKKDYVRIAEVLKSEKPNPPLENRTINTWDNGAMDEWSTIVLNFARMLSQDNPRFDRERFLKACGYNQ